MTFPDPTVFTEVINSYLPETHAALLNGIIFGVKSKTDKVFYDQLKTVGLIHIVVLSGMNITLLSTLITKITSFLSKKISIIISILSIILFIIFVGPAAPIIRAGCMGILTLIAVLFGRKTITLYSLLLSAIFIAIFWPQWPKTISFQLSYAATFGLIIFTKPISKDDKKNNTKISRIKNYLSDELYTSLAAQVFTVPLIFIFFRQISFISPLANILVSWLIAPLMIFGFLTAFLGSIHYYLGLIPSYICYIILSYIIFIVKLLAEIPFASVKF